MVEKRIINTIVTLTVALLPPPLLLKARTPRRFPVLFGSKFHHETHTRAASGCWLRPAEPDGEQHLKRHFGSSPRYYSLRLSAIHSHAQTRGAPKCSWLCLTVSKAPSITHADPRRYYALRLSAIHNQTQIGTTSSCSWLCMTASNTSTTIPALPPDAVLPGSPQSTIRRRPGQHQAAPGRG